MDQEKIKLRLLQNVSRLFGRSDRIDAHWRQKPPSDWEELAVFRENDEVINYLDGRTREQLSASLRALKRMDTKQWEYCVHCGEKIQSARLVSLPTTSQCVRCAKLAESSA